jgi:hypothetical protein
MLKIHAPYCDELLLIARRVAGGAVMAARFGFEGAPSGRLINTALINTALINVRAYLKDTQETCL